MARNNEKEKIFSILEKNVSVISAVNNPKLGPNLDVFRHYPENILLQNLGILTGFFKINDPSEESSYIVNFLSSVLKKEYYANPKKNIESSFDSALRKVNLALSEIAKEGNVNWLGKIDGAVCVLEKNNLHFSVCGKAKVFLFRNKMFSEISVDMASEEDEPNPIKTFVNVSSGRLEKGDKILICENDVFKVFSEEEIRKGALRFPEEKFIQFIKTALINKLEIVGTIIIDIFEKEMVKPVSVEKDEKTYNVFSKKVFEEKKTALQRLPEILKQEEKTDYTDGKTGHIYIQEEKDGERKKDGNFGIFWFNFKEKMADAFFWTKSRTRKQLIYLGKALGKAKNSIASGIKSKLEERKRIKLEKTAKKAEEAALRMASSANNISTRFFEEENKEETEKLETFSQSQPEQTDFKLDISEKQSSFLEKLARRKEELGRMGMGEKPAEEKGPSFAQKILPRFGKAKKIFSSFSKKQKLSAVVIILLIFIVPYVFLKIQGAIKSRNDTQQTQEKIPDSKEILSQEKNIVFLDNLENVFDIQNPKSVMVLGEKIVAMNDSEIVVKDTDGSINKTSWSQDYGSIKSAVPMKDLNLALIYTDQDKVISFFSATSQLTENKISTPTGSKITGVGTYLTYLYLLDSNNSQIYRYPRAEGGFGDKINWLKDNLNLSDAFGLAIDENIYTIVNGEVLKIFKGQRQDFNLEKTINPINPDRIFTDGDTQNIYVLDKANGRIIKYSKDGSLVGQYFHKDIKNAIDFAMDEKNSKAFLIDSQKVYSFSL